MPRREVCRFAEGCTWQGCHHVHPWDHCRVSSCSRPGCWFIHPHDMCRFGSSCVAPSCRHVHPFRKPTVTAPATSHQLSHTLGKRSEEKATVNNQPPQAAANIQPPQAAAPCVIDRPLSSTIVMVEEQMHLPVGATARIVGEGGSSRTQWKLDNGRTLQKNQEGTKWRRCSLLQHLDAVIKQKATVKPPVEQPPSVGAVQESFSGSAGEGPRTHLACKYFPACRHGSQCQFLHPEVPCQFGQSCDRAGCMYLHAFEEGLPEPQVLARLLTLMVAEEERNKGTPWVSINSWRKTAFNWGLTQTTRKGKFVKGKTKKQLLACFGFSKSSPVLRGKLSPFRLGGQPQIGFPPREVLQACIELTSKRAASRHPGCLFGGSLQTKRRKKAGCLFVPPTHGTDSCEDDEAEVDVPWQNNVNRFLASIGHLVETSDKCDQGNSAMSFSKQTGKRQRKTTRSTEIAGGIGFDLLTKMGWQSGQGLGLRGQGDAVPVSAKLQMQSAKNKKGLGFKKGAPPAPGGEHKRCFDVR